MSRTYHLTLIPVSHRDEQPAPPRYFDIHEDEELTVSRLSKRATHPRPEQKILFDCPVISRNHAAFRSEDTSLTLTDLGSTHGTWVNDEKLEVGSPHELASGDLVEFGTTVTNGTVTHDHVRVNVDFTRDSDDAQINEDPTQRFAASFRPYDSAEEDDDRELVDLRDADQDSLDETHESSAPTSPSVPVVEEYEIPAREEPPQRALEMTDVLFAATHRFDPVTKQFTYADSTVETTTPGTTDLADRDPDSTFRCRPTGLPEGPLPIKLSRDAARAVIKGSGIDKTTCLSQTIALDIDKNIVARGGCSQQELDARLAEAVNKEVMSTQSKLTESAPEADVSFDQTGSAQTSGGSQLGRKRKFEELYEPEEPGTAVEAGSSQGENGIRVEGQEEEGMVLPPAKKSRGLALAGGQPAAMFVGALVGAVATVAALSAC